MVLRNVAKTFSLEQQRVEINLIAADLHSLSQVSETDPIFGASPAASITAQQITNWDLAYTWGDHGAVGYLTSFTETDPIFVASPAANITQQQIINWNSAYNWGNHANAGYLTSNAIAVADIAPASPTSGDLWWNSNSGVLKVYYQDVDTSQWVDASPTASSVQGAKVITSDLPPMNPVQGDLWWNSSEGSLKVYFSDGDSNQWVDASPGGIITGGGVSVTTSDAPPLNPIDGDLWWKSDDGVLKVYYDDGNTQQWVDASPGGVITGGGASVTTSDVPPSNAADGDLWWQSDVGVLKIYYDDGNTQQWVDASPGGTSSAPPSILHADVASFPAVGASESLFAYADDTGSMYYSNGVSWTSQRLVTTNSVTSSDFATLLTNSQLTYTINALDHTGGTTEENDNRKVIRLEDSSGTTDQIVLVSGDGLSINRTGDEIELVNDVANSTYSISAESASGNADSILRLTDNAGVTDDITFAGADGLTVERTDENTITFRAPSGASGGTYTAEDAQDAASQLFVNGTHTGISFTYNDANNTIDATVTGGNAGGGTTYDLLGSNTTSNNAILTLRDANNNDDDIEIAGSGGTTVTWDGANNRITLGSTAPVQPDWDATSGLGEILNKPTIPSEYTLPIAAAGTLGGIKVGANLSIDVNGVLSANPGSYTLPVADATTLGGIKVGSGLSIDGNGVLTATGGSTVPQIQDLTGTTGSVADNNTTELNITGYKAYALFKITVDTEAWVRVYVDDASRDADLTRSEGQDPTPGSGVIAEVRTSGAESILTSPGIMGFNNDNPRTDNIYLSVTNRSGNPTPITVTLTALQIGE